MGVSPVGVARYTEDFAETRHQKSAFYGVRGAAPGAIFRTFRARRQHRIFCPVPTSRLNTACQQLSPGRIQCHGKLSRRRELNGLHLGSPRVDD